MSEKMLNILWIDDEHHKLPGLHLTAKDFGIKLFPYKSMNGGCGELEKNYRLYDAILLDAKFFENEDDTPGSEDTKWVHRSKDRILQLPKKFEYFVLTGQAKTYASEEFNNAFPFVFEKGKNEDEEELFNRLVIAANSQEDTQLRHQYQRVLNICTEKYLGEYAGQDLLTILKGREEIEIDSHFTTIRKIVEDIFTAFNKYQLLPIEFVSPNVALNQSSKFLAGEEQDERTAEIYKQFKHKIDTHLPKQIVAYIKNILAITQPGAHRSEIDAFVKTQKTPYLFNCVLYQLLDVIVWVKEYIDSSPKTNNWTRINNDSCQVNKLIKGTVINFNPYKGFAFLEPLNGNENIYIPIHLISNNNLKEGDIITGEVEEYTDNRTQEIKKRIKRIEIK